jgi:hypothetical protein
MAANIAQLFHDRVYCTTRSDRLRFLRHYLAQCPKSGSLRGWIYLIELFAQRHTAAQNRKRDRRICGNNGYFSKIELPGEWRGHVVLRSKRKPIGSTAADIGFTRDQWIKALSDPLELQDETKGNIEIVKDSPSGRVVRRKLRIGDRQLDVYIKRPKLKTFWKVFLSAFRRSRSHQSFSLGHRLLTRRISTAIPLATLERRRGLFLKDNILITEAVDCSHLHDFMVKWFGSDSPNDPKLKDSRRRQLYRDVLWELGRIVQRLHDNNFFHRDLKATNLRIHWDAGERPEILLVDLDGVSQVCFMTMRRRFRGLMRLNVSLLQCPPVNHSGRLRMLLGYLRRPGTGRINFKPFWRLLEEWSEEKLRMQIRSRRKKQKAIRRPG